MVGENVMPVESPLADLMTHLLLYEFAIHFRSINCDPPPHAIFLEWQMHIKDILRIL